MTSEPANARPVHHKDSEKTKPEPTEPQPPARGNQDLPTHNGVSRKSDRTRVPRGPPKARDPTRTRRRRHLLEGQACEQGRAGQVGAHRPAQTRTHVLTHAHTSRRERAHSQEDPRTNTPDTCVTSPCRWSCFECSFRRRKSRTSPSTRRRSRRPPLPSAATVWVRRRGPAMRSVANAWPVWLLGTLLLPLASAQYSDLPAHPWF